MELSLVPFMPPLTAVSKLPVTTAGVAIPADPRAPQESDFCTAASCDGSHNQGLADLPAGLCSIATKVYLFLKSTSKKAIIGIPYFVANIILGY